MVGVYELGSPSMNPVFGHVSPRESFQSSVRLCVCLHSSDSTALHAVGNHMSVISNTD